jgi:glycosyltransferase involved in cell wall biosynthesis
MRIAYMLTSLGIGGAERQTIALAERMNARGHDVVLMVLRAQEEREWPAGVSVVRLDMKKSPFAILRGLIRGRRILRNFKPDILHSHTFPANLAARLLRLLGAAPTILSTIHNVYEGGVHRTLVYCMTDWLSVHSAAVSHAVAERAICDGVVPRRKCSVITNGIDLTEFSSELLAGLGVRRSMNPQNDFAWLAAGRDVAAKDFDNLLEAFKCVRMEFPHVQLWIAGQFAERRFAGREGESFESEAVRWLGVRENMAATLAAADGFVLSSAWEGMPLVVGEAMSMEKPVVATDVGGVRELVGETGVIVPPKDPTKLANAMLQVMRASEDERVAMGRAARDRILQHFNMASKTEEWERLYSSLLTPEVKTAQPEAAALLKS